MKKILLYSGVVILLIGSFSIYHLFIKKDNTTKYSIGKEELKQKNFLKDKQGVIYFSTTAEQDMDGKGISYAVFINQAGEVKGYKMHGLELGGIVVGENEVLLQDKNTFTLVGKDYNEFQFDHYQHTGEHIGYLEKQKIFISIFNSGVNRETGTYDSNVLFGNREGFKKANIPEYLATSGIDQEGIVGLSKEIKTNKYELFKGSIKNNELILGKILQLDNSDNFDYSSLSPIISDDKYYYFVLSENPGEINENRDAINVKTVVFRINKETLKQEKIILSTQKTYEQETAVIPFNIKNSSSIFDNVFYYIDGIGRVFTLEQESNKPNVKFTIENAPKDGVRYNDEVRFKDNKLYVLRYNKEKDVPYFIERYSLETGKKDKETAIKGLDEMLSSIRGKSVHSYDFEIFD